MDAQNAELDTALHLAVASGSLHAVQVLLAAGANVASTHRYSEQPLHVAAKLTVASQAVPIIRALLDAVLHCWPLTSSSLLQLTMPPYTDIWRLLLFCWMLARLWMLG